MSEENFQVMTVELLTRGWQKFTIFLTIRKFPSTGAAMAHPTRRALLGGAALAPFVLLAAGGRASASVEQVTIASGGEWGARPPSGALTIVQRRPNKIIVHHTAMENSTDYSRAH